MGGGQSQETRAEDGPDRADKPPVSPGADGSASVAAADTPGELPQCRMGDRRVDNMCFMISCTNWY